MKALLDTNIIILREAAASTNADVGILYKYLEKAKYEKCIHPITIEEIKRNPNEKTVASFLAKMGNYTEILSPAPINEKVLDISQKLDINKNDKLDSILLNEVFCDRVEILITEDKKIHTKAALLNIQDRVFKIESFLEKIASEYPALINYKVLSVKQSLFGNININDPFFNSFKDDYPGFQNWFNKKASDKAYITINTENGMLLSFLYLKVEGKDENYSDIEPSFKPKKRLKIGTFKVVGNGVRLGERFLKVIFDNALANKVDEIYVTIFDRSNEQKRLIELLIQWGFKIWGKKNNGELVLVRDFSRLFSVENLKGSYPFVSRSNRFFLVPIYPEYHTELFPDSILTTESPFDFVDNEPHRNAISKVYVSRSIYRDIKAGDILIFYRTGGKYKGVVSTICIAEEAIHNCKSEEEFVIACRKRSVFSEQALREQWKFNPKSRPFIVSMLYVYSFPKRSNLDELVENGVISSVLDAPRGFHQITKEKFETVLKLTQTNQNFIID